MMRYYWLHKTHLLKDYRDDTYSNTTFANKVKQVSDSWLSLRVESGDSDLVRLLLGDL